MLLFNYAIHLFEQIVQSPVVVYRVIHNQLVRFGFGLEPVGGRAVSTNTNHGGLQVVFIV